MSTKVFAYGALRPGPDLIAQMRLGHDYYNRLVEAENARRRALWGADVVPPPPHDDCKCKECGAHWKCLRETFRAGARLDLKPLRAQIVSEGLYWGTYLQIEQAFSAAAQKTRWTKTLRFHSWNFGAQAAVQIQKGSKPANYIMIEPAEDNRVGYRKGQRHTARLRIGSKGRLPIWSEPIRFEMHRPLDGQIVGAAIVRKTIGDRDVWSVQVTCKGVAERTDLAVGGVVAIDIGWRRVGDGMRIAMARGDDGGLYEFRLEATGRRSGRGQAGSWLELTRRADRIRSVRDQLLNEVIATHPELAGVRSPRGVKRRAREHGLDVEAWARRDRHLWQYEVGCRRRSVDIRRDATRKWVRELRRQYEFVVVKNSSHKKLKEQRELPRPARRQGHHAAPGEVIETIRKTWGDERMFLAEAPGTSATCKCGTVNELGAELMLTCERCGRVEDRDHVSTRNILAAHQRGETIAPTARKTSARFVKRHSPSDRGSNASAEA